MPRMRQLAPVVEDEIHPRRRHPADVLEDLGSFAKLVSAKVAGLPMRVGVNDQKALAGPWVTLAHASDSHGHIPGLKH